MIKTKKELYAVYGTLKKEYGNNRLLVDSKFIGTTKTAPKFTMYHLGGFPGVKEEGDTPVEIEVYEVENPITKRNLDNLEGYTEGNEQHNFYNRIQIPTEFGKAFIYIYNGNSERKNIIKNGKF